MTRWVVDASVAVKWLLPEALSAEAQALVTPENELLAPALLPAEVGNALVKRARTDNLFPGVAEELFADFRQAPVAYRPIEPLLEPALSLALGHRASLYDCLYLALAEASDAKLVTADRRFLDTIRRGPLASSIIWIEDAV